MKCSPVCVAPPTGLCSFYGSNYRTRALPCQVCPDRVGGVACSYETTAHVMLHVDFELECVCVSVLSLKFHSDSRAKHQLCVKEHRVRAETNTHRPPDRTLLVLNVPPYCSQVRAAPPYWPHPHSAHRYSACVCLCVSRVW